MESIKFSENIQGYLKQQTGINEFQQLEIAKGTTEIIGRFFYDFYVPSSWHLVDIERVSCSTMIFYWETSTEQAVCPLCNISGCRRFKSSKKRRIQDLPMGNMTVYHIIKQRRFFCDTPWCTMKIFVERFEVIVFKDARKTNRLKDFIVRSAIESSSNGTTRTLNKLGIIIGKDTVIREVKKKAASVVEQNLNRDDVKVLSMDDINLRKGNSSTACSVFIDEETHRVLVIVQGATSEVAEKVIKQFPSADMVSRDRGTAYASAAKKQGKIQVADGFHLVQNIHKVVKDALALEFGHDLFVREGDGWIRMIDSPSEEPNPDDCKIYDDQALAVIKPATLAADDIERRVHLAGLYSRQAQKYKKTLAILELAENGLRTPEIAKRMSIKVSEVVNHRKNAPETIMDVENKIDEYYQMHEQGEWEYHQRTISKKARSSSESIVEPYKETVLRMYKEGKNHRNIHPVIVQEGFEGSSNAVYQYLIKYAHENNIPYGRNSRVIPTDERNSDIVPRPTRILIERASKETVYTSILHAAATSKEEIRQSLIQVESTKADIENQKEETILEERMKKTNYSDSIAEIIFDTRPKTKGVKKKLNNETFQRLGGAISLIPKLITFLVAFYEVLLSLNAEKLDCFISKYENDSIESISVFTSGLRSDYDAVKNCLLYPYISNGPIEGTNNKIKTLRRMGYGRAGIELINALAVLPWYYKDIDNKSQLQTKSAA